MGADPVLLLHGQPGAGADWRQVQAAIDGRVRTIAPDRPGWDGRSNARGLAGNGAAMLALLDEDGVRRVTVVGHSFGGAVACWLGAHAPERVSALVLAAPAGNPASMNDLDRWLAAPLFGMAAAAAVLGGASVVLSSSRARGRVSARMRVPEVYLGEAGRILRSPRAWRSFAHEQRALLQELPELERALDAITAPTAVVVGSGDRVVPLRSAELLSAEIPHAELHVLSGVGHLLPLFAAERLAKVIVRVSGGTSDGAP